MAISFDKGHALVIGISNYDLLNKLPQVIQNDANDLADLLTDPSHCGYLLTNIRLLLDADATKENIVEGLKWLASEAHSDGTAVVYFSGHGAQVDKAQKNYLCPVEFDLLKPEDSGIEAEELTALIDAIPASRVAVMLDSCHAGGAGVLKDSSSDAVKWGFGSPALDKLGHGAGRVILASCAANEVSYVLGGKRNSLFTSFLLAGLKGETGGQKDGVVRVLDLFSYVSTEVPRSKPQHPVLKANTQDNFPISLRKGGFKSAGSSAGEADNVAQTTLTPGVENLFASLYPAGPTDSEVWSRAGGDIATLKLGLSGRAAWHAAIRMLQQGGGGKEITLETLVQTALIDFPNNQVLRTF